MRDLILIISTCITAVSCGLDYETEVDQRQDVVKARKSTFQWLVSQRNINWGWGTRDYPETHRILTAISLSGEIQNETESLEYQLSVKQLENELSFTLLRLNEGTLTDQLALYANALLATCRNPNDFYGHNIVNIMKDRPKLSTYAEILVSLASCNSGNILHKKELSHLFDVFNNYANQTHVFPDTKAMASLVLSCTKKSHKHHHFVKAHLRQLLKSFKKSQKLDGSFGNIYSSALAMQALIGARDKGNGWSFQKGISYILSQQKKDGSFADLLATSFVLPVLAGKSLLNLGNFPCNTVNVRVNGSSEGNETEGEECREIIFVRYSIWGNTFITHVFDVPENSTFLDVMEVAQNLDDRYRFSGVSLSWGFYVQTIGNLSNDLTCNRHWTFQKVDMKTGEAVQTRNGVAKEIPRNGDHYMFRYKHYSVPSYWSDTCNDKQQDSNATVTTTESYFNTETD